MMGRTGRFRSLSGGLSAALLVVCGPAFASEAAPASADPPLDAHVMRIAAELRCLVCQNQSIAESHADLAVDLRNTVRTLLRQGRSDAEIRGYMTARYGDFVLYRPPLKSNTALLWFGPALMLAGGGALLAAVLVRRSRMSADRFAPDLDETQAAGGLVDVE